MPTTTLATIREYASKRLGDWLECTTTTNISAGVYITSTELNRFKDDKFNDNYWVIITSGTNIGVSRVAKDFIASSGRLEVYGSNLAAETTSVTFELHRYDTDILKDSINRAIHRAFPCLCVQTPDPNPHFEYWDSTSEANGWTASGVTVAQEATNTHNGTYSMKLTGTGYVYATADDLGDETVIFSKWVKSGTASACRLRIYDGVNEVYSKYHTGGSAWELLECQMKITSGAQTTFYVYQDVSATTYVDGAGDELDTGIGAAFLSPLASETDVAEITSAQAEALGCLAAGLTLQAMVMPIGSADVTRTATEANRMIAEGNDMLSSNMTLQPITKRTGGWLGTLTSEA